MGLGKLLKKVAKIALPIAGTLLAPGIGTALGSTLSTAALGGIGGALGGGLGGAIDGGGLSGALKGAALGGAGGYLSSGGLEQLLGSTSLSTGSGLTGDFANGITGGAADSPITQAARSAISSTSTPTSLSGVLPSAGTVAGGGTSGGFFTGGGLAPQFAEGLSTASPSLFSDPLAYLTEQATSGVKDVFNPSNLLKGGAKSGLSYLLQNDNEGGYGAIQNAATGAAQNFQPFLDSGVDANAELAALTGLNGPEAASAAMNNFQLDPGYTFARDQGIKALDASAASKGMLRSGNQEQAVQGYGTGLANKYFDQYLNRLASIANQGQSAAGHVGENNVDAATAYALLKAQKANQLNGLSGSLSNFF